MDDKTLDITDRRILALSWNIATEPALYWQLIPNPYSHTIQQIMSERFPDFSISEIILAIILAEPERAYDRNFKLLGTERQREALRQQKEISMQIDWQLAEYYQKYGTQYRKLPKEFVYKNLSNLIFKTDDTREIEQKYSQQQRRDIKLSIINFIENIQKAPKIRVTESRAIRSLQHITFAVLSCILLFCLISMSTHSIKQIQAQKHTLGLATQNIHNDIPVRLRIPSINIDTIIQNVGITTNGTMGVPDDTLDVGWYDLGPQPGEKGNAVIAGHVDNEDGTTGIFTHLNDLKQGDKVYVETNNGKTITFIVRGSHIYNPGYAETVFTPSNQAHLNLITCEGVWDTALKSYSKRLVVFADIVD